MPVVGAKRSFGRTSMPAKCGQRSTLILIQRWSVVMKQRRRIYYSAAQRSEIWDRWQAGEPRSSIGRRFDRESSSVFSVISPTGALRIGAGPNRRLAFLKERRSLDGSARAARCGRSRATCDDLRQLSAVKSSAMAERIAIELPGPIRPPGIGGGAPSFASWLAVRS